jgi:hypothetical protein
MSDKQIGGDHYKKLDIQPWDVMQAWFPDSFPDYLLMNALKYICRNKTDKREDIAKAAHYLEEWLRITAPATD